MEKITNEKYIRQIMLFGEEGQEKLKKTQKYLLPGQEVWDLRFLPILQLQG